ncbi:MAG: hypothetical protein HYZ81_10440 [Nitrospinae bacterium]|nr:hypothetical protein [Nitrospinota bacterium]
MSHGHETTGKRRKWLGMLVLLTALLLITAVPGHAWRGMGGFRGTHPGFSGFRGTHPGFSGFRGTHPGFSGFRGAHHRFRHARVFITGSFVVPFGPVWAPVWVPDAYPYAYPPVAAPPPPHYWYACDDPQGYYPYIQQCPGGWRPVAPTPPLQAEQDR